MPLFPPDILLITLSLPPPLPPSLLPSLSPFFSFPPSSLLAPSPPSLQAQTLLQQDMHVVKEGMGHKDLSLDEYTSIWEECYREVLYVPGQNRYTWASMASN